MKWKEGEFEIHCAFGKIPGKMRTVLGWVSPPFGIRLEPFDDLTDPDTYGLTHLPTGRRIVIMNTRRELEEVVEQLLEDTPGGVKTWATTDPKKVREAIIEGGSITFGEEVVQSWILEGKKRTKELANIHSWWGQPQARGGR